MSKSLSFFRLVSLIEGTSLVFLIFVAMPLKYQLGYHNVVPMAGWTHGFMFLAYVAVLLVTSHIMKWSVGFFLLALGASVIPAGTYLLDIKLRRLAMRGI